MSGHSKWATTHRQKEVKDAARGQIFTKMANAITIAVRSGGGIGDPDKNFRLRLAIERAKAVNTPNENITRAIKRGIGGESGVQWEEITYEGFAPGGIAVVVETATDNRNRTSSLIRNIFEKNGGSMGVPGSVMFQFKKVGLISLKKSANLEEQELKLIDLGVEDIKTGEEVEVLTAPENLSEFREKLEVAGEQIMDAAIILQALTPNKIENNSQVEKILKFIDQLEEQDDVQKVYTNLED